MKNLLINPGYEGIVRPGGYTHLTHTGERHGNFVSPDGWTGYWDEKGGRRRPETKVIQRVPPFVGPPCRIYSGDWAYLMFVSFHAWTGGFYQIVDGLEIGAEYLAGFAAHAWVANPDLPHSEDPGCAPMGCCPLYRLENELPPISGDPVQDAWHAALFQVGVQYVDEGWTPDPTYAVMWGQAAAIYNAYDFVPPLRFTAQGSRVAVLTKGAFRYGLRNNDAYVDDAFLRKVEPMPERPYKRTYVLLPPDVTLQEAHTVLDTHFDARQTVGFSADDAGAEAPNTTERNVIAYRAGSWPGDLRGFFETYYPGIDSYEERPLGEEPPPPPPPDDLLLAQRDPDWVNAQFGSGSCNFTIGQQGCFITCLAMAQRYYGIQDDATPVTVDEQLGPDGYISCTANWYGQQQLYRDVLGLGVRNGSLTQATMAMAEEDCVLAEMLPASLEHFVLVYEKDGAYIALDPWEDVRRPFALSEAQSWRILTHVGPQPPPPPPPTTDKVNRVSIHLQTMIPGVKRFLQTARPASVKRVTGMQDLQTMKGWAPWIKTVYRHDGNPEGALQFCDPYGRVTSESLRCAGDWLNRYKDSLITVSTCGLWSKDDPFYMEGPNEFGWAANDIPKIKRAASLERSWLIKLAELNIPVSPITFCAGVGNIGRDGYEEEDFLLLVDLAKETAAMGGGFGLHHYWTPGKLVENWKILGGRYQWIDKVLCENGVRGLKWFLGEGGIAGCVNNWLPLEGAGWRHPCGHDSNWPAYLAEILEWNRRTQEWNSTHGNRCEILNLFTTGIGPLGWDDFLLKTSQLDSLAGALS